MSLPSPKLIGPHLLALEAAARGESVLIAAWSSEGCYVAMDKLGRALELIAGAEAFTLLRHERSVKHGSGGMVRVFAYVNDGPRSLAGLTFHRALLPGFLGRRNPAVELILSRCRVAPGRSPPPPDDEVVTFHEEIT